MREQDPNSHTFKELAKVDDNHDDNNKDDDDDDLVSISALSRCLWCGEKCIIVKRKSNACLLCDSSERDEWMSKVRAAVLGKVQVSLHNENMYVFNVFHN